MTLQATPYADTVLYFPIPVNSTPTDVYIDSLSFFDINQQIFVADYIFEVGSTYYNMNAFIAYPQSVSLYIPSQSLSIQTSSNSVLASSISSVVFRNENIYDETAYAFIGNNLVTYSDQAFKTSPVASKNVTGSQYVVFWNGDVLIIYTQPYSVIVYSVSQNKFFTYTIPTNLESNLVSPISVSFLGGYLYVGILVYASNTGDIYAYLLCAKFSYSNGQLSTIFSKLVFNMSKATSSSSGTVTETTVLSGITVRTNGSYVVLVSLFTYLPQFSSIFLFTGFVTCVVFVIYNINTGNSFMTSSTISGTYMGSILYVNQISITVNGVKINILSSNIDMTVSIYAYNIFVVLYSIGTPPIIVLSFNIRTSSTETTGISPPSPQSNLYSGIFIQGNIVYMPVSWSSVVQYGSTYYVPIRFVFYQVTTSDMIGVQLTDYQLYKNTLTISGIVKYLQTGQPVPNAYVTIYEYSSVQGNQFAVKKALVQTTTNENGEFTLTYTYSSAPPFANIIITAGVDPIMVETILPTKPVEQVPYYYSS